MKFEHQQLGVQNAKNNSPIEGMVFLNFFLSLYYSWPICKTIRPFFIMYTLMSLFLWMKLGIGISELYLVVRPLRKYMSGDIAWF
jgi:hypothetical protein